MKVLFQVFRKDVEVEMFWGLCLYKIQEKIIDALYQQELNWVQLTT